MEPLTPPISPRAPIECPNAPIKKARQITPPSSPRAPIECPSAPKKISKCYGCYVMKKYGYGGENQQAHMDDDGCLRSHSI